MEVYKLGVTDLGGPISQLAESKLLRIQTVSPQIPVQNSVQQRPLFITEVVGVSSEEFAVLDEPLVCDFCGFEIEEVGQQCAALDDGRCRP